MSRIEKRTFSLPHEHMAFIDEQVESGHFASASEVIRAGIRALQQHHTAVERWLETEVAATYDKLMAAPDSTHSSEDVFEALRAHHAKSLKGEA